MYFYDVSIILLAFSHGNSVLPVAQAKKAFVLSLASLLLSCTTSNSSANSSGSMFKIYSDSDHFPQLHCYHPSLSHQYQLPNSLQYPPNLSPCSPHLPLWCIVTEARMILLCVSQITYHFCWRSFNNSHFLSE